MTTKTKSLSKYLANKGVKLHDFSNKEVMAAWGEYQIWVNQGLAEGRSVLDTARDFRQHQVLQLSLHSLTDICDLLRGFRDHFYDIRRFLS